MKVPEKYRITENHPLSSDKSYGNNGAFLIPTRQKNVYFFCIVGTGMEWEHVSVTLRFKSPKTEKQINRCPTWEEMCIIKDLFWDETECVVQYHPPKSDHISLHNYCLHLWKPIGEELKRPPKIMVGV